MEPSIEIREAKSSDVESLTTILPRSYYPVYPYVKEALPDTPAMRAWWREVFATEVEDAACHPVIAIDNTTSEVVGVCCLRLINAEGPYGDFWSLIPWTPDHSPTKWKPVIDCLVHYEKKFVRGKTYFQLEFLAVDHAYKSKGLGGKLLEKVCEIADAAGHLIFVQSGIAKNYYVKTAGFEIWEEPKWNDYQSCFLGRQPKKAADDK